jgi:hypothetical protein
MNGLYFFVAGLSNEGGANMNQRFWNSEARDDRRRSADPGKGLSTGLALLAIMGVAGCGGDPTIGDEESIDSVSQAWGPDGKNGITPAILAANYLSNVNTFAANVNSPGDQRPITLCGSLSYDTNTSTWSCGLKAEWTNWLFGSGGPADVKNRYNLLVAMIHCSMPPSVVVHVPSFPSVKGMFGMYMSWTVAPLEMHEREVVSACVGAKVNAFGAVVPIAFVGPNVPQSIGDPSFAYQEATFFGDLFGKAPLLMACSGKKDGGGTYVVGRSLRICGEINNPCNIRALGACEAGTYVCPPGSMVGSGPDEHCTVAANGVGGVFKHSLMVYLKDEPKLLDDPIVARCGMSGKEVCDDEKPPP